MVEQVGFEVGSVTFSVGPLWTKEGDSVDVALDDEGQPCRLLTVEGVQAGSGQQYAFKVALSEASALELGRRLQQPMTVREW